MRRFVSWIARFLLLSLVLGAVGGYLFADHYYNDKALAKRICDGFNKTHRGRLYIERIHWKPTAVLQLLKDSYDDVEITDLRIYDSRGALVLRVPRAVGRIRLWDIILRGDFFLERLTVRQAAVWLERFHRPDGPNAEGANTEVGLVGAFEKRTDVEEETSSGDASERQTFIVVDRFDLSGVSVHGHFAPVRFDLSRGSLGGGLRYASAGGGRPASLHYDLRPRAAGGAIQVRNKRFSLAALEVDRLAATREHPDQTSLKARVQVDAARLALQGGLVGLGSDAGAQIALQLRVEAFAEVASKLLDRSIEEEGSVLRARVTGPVSDPRTRLHLHGLGMRSGAVALRSIRVNARYATGLLTLKEARAKTLGGRLRARGRLVIGSGAYRATVEARRVRTAQLLPPDNQSLAGTVSGWLDAEGALADLGRGFTRFRFTLDRIPTPGPLPTHVSVSGALYASASRLDVRRLTVQSPEMALKTHGRIWPQRQQMDLALKAEARRLRRTLLRMGKPPLVAAARLFGRLRGTFDNPTFHGRGTAFGIRSGGVQLRRVNAALALRNGTVHAMHMRAALYRGQLYGQARVGLFRGSLRRPYRRTPLWARGGVRNLDLEPATGGAVEALVNGRFRIRGTPGFLRGQLRARSRVLWAARQWYRDARLRVTFRGDRYEVHRARVEREGGGHVSLSGHFSTARRGKLDLTADVQRLPLAAFPGLDGERPPATGTLTSRHLHLGGTFGAPVLDGTLHLVRAALRQVGAGGGAVTLRSEGNHTRLSGRLLPWVHVERGRLDLGSRKRVSLRVRLADVPLERFVPELRAGGRNVTGRLSGTLLLEIDARHGLRRAHLDVDKLWVRLVRPEEPFSGQSREAVLLRNKGPLRLTFEDGQLRVERFVLTDGHDLHRLRLAGTVSPHASRLRLHGQVDLVPLEVLLATQFERLRGVVAVDLTVTGPPTAARIAGTLYPAGVVVRTPDLDGEAVVRAGVIRVSNRALTLAGLRVQIVDDEVEVNGRIALASLRPTTLDLSIRGNLSPSAIELIASAYVDHATGAPSRVRLRLVGPVAEPYLLGRLNLGVLSMGLQSTGKELGLQSGRVEFGRDGLTLTDVRGTLDGGPFALDGEVALKGLSLDGVNLHFVGESIPHRSGGSYEVEVSPDVTLSGRGPPETGWTLAGIVDVVEGRYIQKFDINPVQRILSPRRTYESSEPFYAGSPLLENLRLNLTVSSTGTMRVRNNVADIGLEGDLSVTGTLPDMQIGGTVSVKEGTFRIPFLRGRYTDASGSVDFDRGRAEGKDEPYVRLMGSTTYTDRSETEHEISLTVEGFLSHLVPTWQSNTGLTSSQVLTLLATSRTPDDLRKGRSAGLPNLAPLIEDYIPLDLQLDLSSDSVQVYVERKLGRFFRVKGTGEFGYSGSQRQEGMLIFRVTDHLSLQGRIQRRVQGEDVTEEADTLNGRVEARYRIRLRGNLRRALGF